VIRKTIPRGLTIALQKELLPDPSLLVYGDLFERTFVVGVDAILSLDIDTLKITTHKPDTGERLLVNGYTKNKVAYQSWIDSKKWGHPSTDVFVIDLRDNSIVRLTEGERSQWIPRIHKNLVMWQEVANEKAEDGFGYYVIHDLETGARRRVPGIENDCGVTGLAGKYAAICGKAGSSVSAPMYLVDLEKAGVLKDGHVVPE